MKREAAGFTAPDPRYAERVRASFARQGIMGHLGAALTEVRSGYCEIRLPFRPELAQQHGYFHGGVIGTLGDSAGGYAAFTLMSADAGVLTVEYKMNLLAPGDGELLIARGRVIKAGRSLVVSQADVAVVKDGTERLCAILLQTPMTIQGKPEMQG
ncbi:MAG: PaaI family thioesterase [Pseudomonadota bacterium]